jgi:metallophosphoesterase (TIGR00282 family)
MKLLIFWDIYGRKGRALLSKYLPALRAEHSPDFVMANSENLTSGKWPVPAHLEELRALGVDIFTGGNHSFAQMELIAPYMDAPDSPQLRPANFYESSHHTLPGRGVAEFTKNSKRLLVINLISGNFLKDDVYNPFLRVDEILRDHPLSEYDGIVVDFHRESTAESYCMAEWLSGRVSLQYGTHTHVQTNDDRILVSGTGAMTDIGMTGSLNSSIGQEFAGWIPNFVSGTGHFGPKRATDMGPGVVCGLIVEITAGKCTRLEKIRILEE